MSNLRERCRVFLNTQKNRTIMRVGDPVLELMEFVIAETGRSVGPELDETLPVCLYFESSEQRDDFVSMVQQINPNMKDRKI